MENLKEKNKVIEFFEQGESIEDIQSQSNIDFETLRQWQKQFEVSKEKSKEIKELINAQKFGEAEKLAEEALKLDSDNEILRSQLVTIWIATDSKLDEAEKSLKLRLEQDKQNMHARAQLTAIYMKKGNFKKAEETANEMLAIDKDNLQARSLLILLAKQRMDWERVIKLSNEIIERNPENLPARYQLIIAYRIQKNKDEVERIKNEIIAIDPENRIREEEPVTFATTQEDLNLNTEIIRDFRRALYAGGITLENYDEYEQNLACLPIIQQKTLLAEMYTHLNIPRQAISLLKEAQKDKILSSKEKTTLAQALQIANSNKMNVIQKRKKWGSLGEEQR